MAFAMRKNQLKRCTECPTIEHCILTDPGLAKMDPEVIVRWLEENCPHKPKVKFRPMRG